MKAIDVDCPTCERPAGTHCTTSLLFETFSLCQARINLAAKTSRDANRALRIAGGKHGRRRA